MLPYHKTLGRQIKKILGDKPVVSDGLENLFQSISATYTHFDEDRVLIERSLDLSSRELIELNTEIEKKVIARTLELQQERARLIASISSFPLGILLIDLDNNIILRNSHAASLLGIGQPDFTLAEITARFPKELELAKFCKLCVDEKRTVELNNLLVGNKILRILLSPILVDEQENKYAIGHVFLMEDITAQKLLENSKDAFIAIAAHELRTPLTIIRGNAELLIGLLSKQPSIPEAPKMLLSIREGCIRLLGIVNDFLDITALEGKRMQFNKEEFDVTEPIREVLDELKERAKAKNLYLDLENKAPDARVFADRSRTKEVILNMTSNAVQYTEKGGIKITVEQDGNLVKILIVDTGIGIQPELQTSLFQKFQTISGRFMHSQEYGSGMGLYISKLLAESMGGKIKLTKSMPGVGSTFEILLLSASSQK